MSDQVKDIRHLGPSKHLDPDKLRVPRVDRFELKTPRKDAMSRDGEQKLAGFLGPRFPRIRSDGG
jgi:hypothetical protein